MSTPFLLSTFLALACAMSVRSAPAISRSDLEIFRQYLAGKNLVSLWQGEPTRIDSEEIRRAYPGLRFYFTYQREPPQPGAPMPEVLALYEKQRAEYRAHSLRITVGIDEHGGVRAFRSADDFNHRLIQPTADEAAAVAAAAIISLLNAPDAPPRVFAAAQFDVQKHAANRVCHLRNDPGIRAEAEFDAAGKCIRITKQPTHIEVPR